MKKLLSVALFSAIGFLSFNSCKKADPDPMGNYTCTCFVVKTDTTSVTRDTVIVHEDMIEKSIATTYCANTQASLTDTFGSVATCTLK